ncbi:hypothetical protein LJ739_17200 [Aestuariibacter halophilus]|uniref:Uncharacterized protein n=1 Tax=Fluctibacter halophilus TaxID=226011 RepID=A0ABS8GDX3_9ALTE|nr:hypothetical protein [Aestuariibacter halophilus]MCC2617994.1 hypothetical protein [Aestuariibacter halophilus]
MADHKLQHVRQLPRIYQVILDWSLPDALNDAISGDVTEAYQQQHQTHPATANVWLLQQVLDIALRFALKTQRGVMMFVISVAVIVAVVLMSLWLSGGLSMFINLPSLLIVLPPAILIAWCSVPAGTPRNALAQLLNGQIVADQSAMLARARFFQVLGNAGLLMGFFGVVTGAIAIASNVEPEVFREVIGPATAVCLLTLQYALVLKTICYLAEVRLKAHL